MFEYVGFSLAPSGDTNADGFDDFLVGANGSAPSGAWTGAAYLVLGGL